HSLNVTTRSASRQPASSTSLGDDDSDVETTIHDPQGPVTLESLHRLILGMNQNLSARLDDLTTRVERLEQARPSPQPHGGNQVARPPQQTRPEASPQHPLLKPYDLAARTVKAHVPR